MQFYHLAKTNFYESLLTFIHFKIKEKSATLLQLSDEFSFDNFINEHTEEFYLHIYSEPQYIFNLYCDYLNAYLVAFENDCLSILLLRKFQLLSLVDSELANVLVRELNDAITTETKKISAKFFSAAMKNIQTYHDEYAVDRIDFH